MTSELERLRAGDGMQLGRWRLYIERKYGHALWVRLYSMIQAQFGGALDRAGLGKPFDDEGSETWRARQVQRVEAAACAWLASVCRGIDSGIADQQRRRAAQ